MTKSERKEFKGGMDMTKNELPRIGHRGDALSLLGEMLEACAEINAGSPPAYQGMENAIGSIGYYWPRLEALRDAIERGIV